MPRPRTLPPPPGRPLTHLIEAIDAQGLRQDWLAERLGVSPSMLTHLLAGRRRLTEDMAEKLARELRLPIAFVRQAPATFMPLADGTDGGDSESDEGKEEPSAR